MASARRRPHSTQPQPHPPSPPHQLSKLDTIWANPPPPVPPSFVHCRVHFRTLASRPCLAHLHLHLPVCSPIRRSLDTPMWPSGPSAIDVLAPVPAPDGQGAWPSGCRYGGLTSGVAVECECRAGQTLAALFTTWIPAPSLGTPRTVQSPLRTNTLTEGWERPSRWKEKRTGALLSLSSGRSCAIHHLQLSPISAGSY